MGYTIYQQYDYPIIYSMMVYPMLIPLLLDGLPHDNPMISSLHAMIPM